MYLYGIFTSCETYKVIKSVKKLQEIFALLFKSKKIYLTNKNMFSLSNDNWRRRQLPYIKFCKAVASLHLRTKFVEQEKLFIRLEGI